VSRQAVYPSVLVLLLSCRARQNTTMSKSTTIAGISKNEGVTGASFVVVYELAYALFHSMPLVVPW